MYPYIIAIILCYFGIYLYDKKQTIEGRTSYFWLVVLYLILLSGLSYKVGGDIYNYERHYVPKLSEFSFMDSLKSGYQPFWVLMRSICNAVDSDFYLTHLVQTAIACPIYAWFIKRNTRYIFTGLLLFFLFIYIYFFFEILRECLSIAFVLIGYHYLMKGQKSKFWLFLVVAYMFHISAIVAAVIPFVQGLKLNRKFLVWLLAFLVFMQILEIYAQNLLFIEKVYQRFEMYQSNNRLNMNWYLISFIKNVIAPLLFLIWMKRTYKEVKYEWAFCVYILCGVGTTSFALLFERPTNYFLPFVLIPVIQLLGESYRKSLKRRIVTFLVVFCLWFCVRGSFYMIHDQWKIIIPYSSIISREADPDREIFLRKYWRY